MKGERRREERSRRIGWRIEMKRRRSEREAWMDEKRGRMKP